MLSFKEFLKRQDDLKTNEALDEALKMLAPTLLEYKTYKKIPGTKCSYREDSANTNSRTQKHAHVYAKAEGGGSELYSVNVDGSGHDGHKGTAIPTTHADYFRAQSYDIPASNILETRSLLSLLILNEGDGHVPFEIIALEG